MINCYILDKICKKWTTFGLKILLRKHIFFFFNLLLWKFLILTKGLKTRYDLTHLIMSVVFVTC